jgi:hypothetical protein
LTGKPFEIDDLIDENTREDELNLFGDDFESI